MIVNKLACWKYEPGDRPDIQNVVSALQIIIPSEHHDVPIVRFNEKVKDNLLNQDESNTKSSKGTIDKELMIDSYEFESGPSLQDTKYIQLYITKSDNISSSSSFQAKNLSRDSFESTLNNINNICC